MNLAFGAYYRRKAGLRRAPSAEQVTYWNWPFLIVLGFLRHFCEKSLLGYNNHQKMP